MGSAPSRPAPIHRVGMIGLGRMGMPMARHLVRAGFEVRGFDVNPEKRSALVAAGGLPGASRSGVMQESDTVLLMVADDAQVREIALGPQGLLETAAPGATLIISSTVKPSTCRAVAEAARARGVGVIDAPVARGQRGAEEGTLTAFVGGPPVLFDACRPVLSAFCSEVLHIAEWAGAGQVAKLANNLMLWAGVVAAHEVLRFGELAGVAPHRLRSALQHGSAEGYVLRELHLINLTWPEKDLVQAAAFAEEIGGVLPLSARVRELITDVTRDELRRLCAPSSDPGGLK